MACGYDHAIAKDAGLHDTDVFTGQGQKFRDDSEELFTGFGPFNEAGEPALYWFIGVDIKAHESTHLLCDLTLSQCEAKPL
jgi:hypothetical protein